MSKKQAFPQDVPDPLAYRECHIIPPMMRGRNGVWYVLAAAVLWGTTGTAQAFAPAGAAATAVGAVRLVIGGGALLLLALWRGSLRGGARWPRRATAWAVASMAVYQPFFFGGVARTGVAVGTVVAIGSAPIVAGVIRWLLQGERPSRRWLWATLLGVAGVALLSLAGGRVTVDGGGVLLALGAGVAYAISALASKEMLKTHPPDAVTAVIFSFAALLLLPLLFVVDLSWLAQPRGAAAALHLGLGATTLAYFLYMRGLRQVQAETAVTLALGEPLTATLLGVFLLGETMTTMGGVGMGLIFVGLLLLSRPLPMPGRPAERKE